MLIVMPKANPEVELYCRSSLTAEGYASTVLSFVHQVDPTERPSTVSLLTLRYAPQWIFGALLSTIPTQGRWYVLYSRATSEVTSRGTSVRRDARKVAALASRSQIANFDWNGLFFNLPDPNIAVGFAGEVDHLETCLMRCTGCSNEGVESATTATDLWIDQSVCDNGINWLVRQSQACLIPWGPEHEDGLLVVRGLAQAEIATRIQSAVSGRMGVANLTDETIYDNLCSVGIVDLSNVTLPGHPSTGIPKRKRAGGHTPRIP